ncbi:glycosyltransferase [bacterium]|nr:MAG: glycosyltransferase [bacterium]
MKIVDVTEFYSERGGGVRSHLSLKGHVLCQLGHEHLTIAPGPRDAESFLESTAGSALDASTGLSTEASARTTSDADARGGTRAENSRSRPVDAGDAQETRAKRARVLRLGGPALPYDPTYHLLFRVDKIRAAIARERPDVVEIDSPYVAAAATLSAPRAHFGVRTFVWHADFIDTYLRPMLERRLERHAPSAVADVALAPLWAMVRGIASGCDATFVAGKWQVEKLEAHGVPRVVYLPFGVEKDVFRPDARSAAARRARLEQARAPAHARLLVGVGRFAVEKRWDVVLSAFRRMRRETGRDAVLVLYGDGPERGRMAAQVARERAEAGGGAYDDVLMPGFERSREALAEGLASADALVHGCPFETFGLGVAEAIAAGLPVVVPSQGGAAESADPATSELFAMTPGREAEACAAAMVRMLARVDGDPERLRSDASRARERVQSKDGYFDGLLATYRELLARRAPRRP